MYNPREAQTDMHVLLIVVLMLVIAGAFVFFSISVKNGNKYFEFAFDTQITEATVTKAVFIRDAIEIEVEPGARESGVQSRYDFTFEDETGNRIVAVVDLPYQWVFGPEDPDNYRRSVVPSHAFEVGSQIDILYKTDAPDEVLPVRTHNILKADRNVMLASIGAMLLAAFLIIRQRRRYRMFRAESSYY